MAVNFGIGMECVRAPGPGADQDVDAEVLERRVEHLFHVGQQAVDFVDEEDLARSDVAQDAGEIELFLQHGSGGLVKGDVQLLGDDGGEGGFAEAGRAVEQDVVHGLAALAGGFDGDGEVFFELGLAGEIGQAARAQAGFELRVFVLRGGGNEPRSGMSDSAYRTNSRARRNRGSNPRRAPAALALRTAASAAGRAQPRFSSAESTSSSIGESAGGAGAAASPPVAAGSLSRSSSTMRSAVFLPTPGDAHQLLDFAAADGRRSGRRRASPESTLTASVGPMPLTPISFSKSAFSSCVRKP